MSKKRCIYFALKHLNATWEQCLPFCLVSESFVPSGLVWYAPVCTVLKYCDKYFVLHQSTGAAKHKLAVYQLLFMFERTRHGASVS